MKYNPFLSKLTGVMSKDNEILFVNLRLVETSDRLNRRQKKGIGCP